MNQKTKTARWIPKGYSLIKADDETGLEVWGMFEPNIYAIAYSGKRSKHDWHYRFKSAERVHEKIDELLQSLRASKAAKLARMAERNGPHDVKVGDIFRASWGYDQTNIDYFQCTKVIGAMIEIREIGQQREEGDYMQGQCVPAPGLFIGEPMRKRVKVYAGGEPSVRVASYCNATRIKPVAEVAGVKVYPASDWSAYA